MKKDLIKTIDNLELPEDLQSEVLLLYNLGVEVEDIKYFIILKLNKVI